MTINKKGGELVCQRPQQIVEARFSLSKRENDILDFVFANVQENKTLYVIDVSKYIELYDVKNKSNLYTEIAGACESIQSKGFSITTETSKVWFNWFASIEYLEGQGKIKLEIGERLNELLILAKNYAFYDIQYSINFKSAYSQRLYYFLIIFKQQKYRKFSVDDLRDKLQTPQVCEVFGQFERRIIKPCVKEINDKSDISVEYNKIKTKNKITHIEFFISDKPVKKKRAKKEDNSATTRVTKLSDEDKKKISALSNIFTLYNIKFTDKQVLQIWNASNSDMLKINKVLNEKLNYIMYENDLATEQRPLTEQVRIFTSLVKNDIDDINTPITPKQTKKRMSYSVTSSNYETINLDNEISACQQVMNKSNTEHETVHARREKRALEDFKDIFNNAYEDISNSDKIAIVQLIKDYDLTINQRSNFSSELDRYMIYNQRFEGSNDELLSYLEENMPNLVRSLKACY